MCDRHGVERLIGRGFWKLLIFAWGVWISGTAQAAQPLLVYTSNYPLAYMAQRIGQDLVDVQFPVPPGVDPALWSPDIETIGRFQQADLVLINGAGYEGWLDKVSLSRKRLVDTSWSFRERYIPLQTAITHSHGPKGEHSHESLAFTTWLDMELASRQAEKITAGMSRILPGANELFQENLAGLREELGQLDQQLQTSARKYGARPIIGSHPVYQYLAGRYGLNIRSVHWEPDQVPGAAQLEELQALLAEHPAQVMLWEDQPLPDIERILKEHGLRVVVFRPCGNRPETGDFMSVMRKNRENLDSAL